MEEIKRELELATLPEMPKRLDYRIGVIGAGFIVRNCHLEAYRKAGFNPVAITSLDQEQSKEVAALHKIQTVYPTWKELVDDKSIEIIDIAVPPHVQPDIVEYICRHAADHVKGILCQKPIAMSLEEARRIVSLGDEAGIPIAVNSNMRYDQSMRALKRILDKGLIGKPVIASALGEIPKQIQDADGRKAGLLLSIKDWQVDPQDICDALLRLVKEPALYEELKANTASVKDKFDLDKIAERYIALYRDVCKTF